MNQQNTNTVNTQQQSMDTSHSTMAGLTQDDLASLQQVLQHVHGAYPDAHYNQADYLTEE